MKFILLNGPSCSGKSTLIKRVMNEKERFYQLSYDSQKWLFSKYTPDVYFEDVRKIIRSLAETVCEMNYNIICDSALHRETREKLLAIPIKHGYEIIEINLEADYEVLEKRFNTRISEALANPTIRVANKSKDSIKSFMKSMKQRKIRLLLHSERMS